MEQFKGIRVYVDMREGGFASGMQVDKRMNIFFEYDPARDVERFLTMLHKNFRNKDYSDLTVTIHLTSDNYERNDKPTHRYIAREWGADSGYEKRPYQGSHQGFPEVAVTPMKKNVRTEMHRAIAEELRALVAEHAPKKDASEV